MNHLQIIQDKFITKVLATIFGARCKPLYIGSCTVHRWSSRSSNDVESEILLLVLYLLLSGKSFSNDKNKAETLLQDFSLFYLFVVLKMLVACAKVHFLPDNDKSFQSNLWITPRTG